MSRRILSFVCMVAMVATLIITGGCSGQNEEVTTYKITFDGTASEAGMISFLDYTINVYQDEASNSCGGLRGPAGTFVCRSKRARCS
ncbi:hypothetical protein [Eubacterium oxidoreducens]|uniref:Uncharacterized protein n=1 Tax=Eubacterium oxidoreducens TaxID=1732 RepID=A0A1G6BP12_EUBOX|nr:hypothetical protein [Eubacterium oxidoreducens]SDB22329.1 hypothetical protein SAMN02910417_01682 [Eubacterium oxidoreducens]